MEDPGTLITRSFVPVSGVQIEVLTIPADQAASPDLQVLVVPGNPGNANYYRSFMRLLHQSFQGKADVVSCSHAGHEIGPHNTGQKLFHFDEQINLKADFIRQHLLLPGRPPLMIIAHSIGSYVTVHAVHRLEAALRQQQQLMDLPKTIERGVIGVNGGPGHATIDVSYDTINSSSSVDSVESATPDLVVNVTSSAVENKSNVFPKQHPDTHAAVSGRQTQTLSHQHQAHAHVSNEFQQQPNVSLPSARSSHSAAQQRTSVQDLDLPDAVIDHLPHRIPPIVKVVALMPFFQGNFSKNTTQRFLRILAQRYATMSALTAVLAKTPLALRVALVDWWTNRTMSREAVTVTCRLLNPFTILNNFYMAKTEFEVLANPFDWGLLRSLGSRFHVLGCPNDDWMSRDLFDHMVAQVPGIQATWHPNLTHAFCVSHEQNLEVVDEVARIAFAIDTSALQPSSTDLAEVLQTPKGVSVQPQTTQPSMQQLSMQTQDTQPSVYENGGAQVTLNATSGFVADGLPMESGVEQLQEQVEQQSSRIMEATVDVPQGTVTLPLPSKTMEYVFPRSRL